jgi:hypothetical protein
MRHAIIEGDNQDPPLPKWLRSAYLTDEDEVYAPAILTGAGEPSVVRRAYEQKIETIETDGHYYFPAVWLALEFPQNADIFLKMIERIRETYPEAH